MIFKEYDNMNINEMVNEYADVYKAVIDAKWKLHILEHDILHNILDSIGRSTKEGVKVRRIKDNKEGYLAIGRRYSDDKFDSIIFYPSKKNGEASARPSDSHWILVISTDSKISAKMYINNIPTEFKDASKKLKEIYEAI
jgi:hypothetical protein